MKFTDIDFNLIERLPLKLRPYALLMRFDRPVGWWLLLLPGWWSIMLASGGLARINGRGLYIFILFFIGAIVMRGAGCVVNDLWDRKMDKQVERTQLRPLASGVLRPWQALLFLASLLCVGLMILLQLNQTTIILGFISLPLIIIYPLMKRVTWWPQIFLGLTFNFGALMGWSAISGTIGVPAMLLYIGGIFWTLGYDTIYAHQDRADDLMAGVKSTALKFGPESKKLVSICYAVTLVLFLLAIILSGKSWQTALLALSAAHMIWQVTRWNMDDPDSSLTVFRSNQIFGLLFLLACAA